MKYAKPEVTLIAVATVAIEGLGKMGLTYDNPITQAHSAVPAYEADE